MEQLSAHLWRIPDSCNVYLITGERGTVCVDFGTGLALGHPAFQEHHGAFIVLVTHHHRDQVQGLPEAIVLGGRAWVPHTEQDMFRAVDEHWQARALFNDYNMRQDRFSLLDRIPIEGTLRDYASYSFYGHTFEVLPTPGHTVGSLSLLAEIDGRRVAFTGDLIAAPGKIWSLAATQWTYNEGEGLAATILSLLALKARRPELLLPSHGEPIADVDEAIDRTVARLETLIEARKQKNRKLSMLRAEPYVALSPHLLWNRTSLAYSYVLLADNGKALFFDFGYDFSIGLAAGADRAARRPWLYSLPALKAGFGVREIGAVIPTHYHDDHVAGINLLREVEGTAVWLAENFADVLARPDDYNLPCLWYDPVPADRVLPLGQPIEWEGYTLTLHPLHGHTTYAVAISLEVDGRRVVVAGDQYQASEQLLAPTLWNYVYRNGFALDDYRASAALFRRLDPQLVLTGHWRPFAVQPDYFASLDEQGETLARLHRDLLLDADLAGDPEEGIALIRPYQLTAQAGEAIELHVTVRNPHPTATRAELRLALPDGWEVAEEAIGVALPPTGEATRAFHVTPHGPPARRTRIAVDVALDGKPLGQQAECLISVRERAVAG
jgi:glyoxylase-like metal-dependent hydrolase (beta-lactamase superfamily II)